MTAPRKEGDRLARERARSLARDRGMEPWTALQLRHSLVGASRVEQIKEALAARRVRLSDEHLARFAAAR